MGFITRGKAAVGTIVVAMVVTMAMAPGAGAATFTVNQTSDAFDAGAVRDTVCDTDTGTVGPQCTLRAAIQEAGDAAVNPGHDTITFDFTLFTGNAATSTIMATSSEPSVSETATIDGGDCDAGAGFKPCVGFQASGGTLGIPVSGNNVVIRGLAITAAATGISVSGNNNTVAGNWFGLRLDEAPQGNGSGVVLDTNNSTMNTIGGETAADRNVFANNTADGVRISGADNNVIKGNYFGTLPDGTTAQTNPPGAGGDNIEVSSVGGLANLASNNTIGGTLSAGQLASPECDGPCNVIANSIDGIDLLTEGDGSPAGSTTIRGNFIGLDAGGQTDAGNSGRGILADAADAQPHTIGGPAAGGRNVISGNTQNGLQASDDVTVQNNFFGTNSLGTAAVPNQFNDAFLGASSSVPINSTVRGNLFAGNGVEPGISLRVNFSTRIAGNTFGIGTGGQDLGLGGEAIRLNGGDNEVGGMAAGDANVIGNQPAGSPAILVFGGDDNDIIGNLLGVTPLGAAVPNGGPGIRITNESTNSAVANIVGGNMAPGENVISNSAGDAIEVIDNHTTGGTGLSNEANAILRNRGVANGTAASDLFIDLRTDTTGDGPDNPADGPNAAIDAPTVTSATNTTIMGTGAVIGATVRVFRTFTTSGRDIRAYIGEFAATADNWQFSYPQNLPDGHCLAVTQTSGSSTSELSNVVAIGNAGCFDPPDPNPGGSSSTPPTTGTGSEPQPQAGDSNAPSTNITGGPKDKTKKKETTFTFNGIDTRAVASFQCSLDGGAFVSCTSPFSFRVKKGKHTFAVRAVDDSGNVGEPATDDWKVRKRKSS